MKRDKAPILSPEQQTMLEEVAVCLLASEERERFDQLLEAEHYLGCGRLVGKEIGGSGFLEMRRQHVNAGELFHELAKAHPDAEFLADCERDLSQGKRVETLLQESRRRTDLHVLAS